MASGEGGGNGQLGTGATLLSVVPGASGKGLDVIVSLTGKVNSCRSLIDTMGGGGDGDGGDGGGGEGAGVEGESGGGDSGGGPAAALETEQQERRMSANGSQQLPWPPT
jgi:hypothetical protein